ncbi:hypothetical protein L6R52_28375, partial [Myxococcota bacterium]|nr:hypothetical protein [Myxococcota bacterium]
EEALYRSARVEVALGRVSDAEVWLTEARVRFPAGPLLPEREALAARLAREAGDLTRAHALLAGAPSTTGSLPLARERVALAERLAADAPTTACDLVAPLLSSRLPSELVDAARRISARCTKEK